MLFRRKSKTVAAPAPAIAPMAYDAEPDLRGLGRVLWQKRAEFSGSRFSPAAWPFCRQCDHAALPLRIAPAAGGARKRVHARRSRQNRRTGSDRSGSGDQPDPARAVARSRARGRSRRKSSPTIRNSIRARSASLAARDPRTVRHWPRYQHRCRRKNERWKPITIASTSMRSRSRASSPSISARPIRISRPSVANTIADGLPQYAAGGEAGPDPRGRQLACRSRSRRCARRSLTPRRRSRNIVRVRICSSAPTIRRCRTSSSPRSIRRSRQHAGRRPILRRGRGNCANSCAPGKPIDSSDIANTESMRRLIEQRIALRAQLAEQSTTLLDQHPRIKELKAQVAEIERQIQVEGERLARQLDNDAKRRRRPVGRHLAQVSSRSRKLASQTNEQDVQLRALEREAKTQRDLLDSYLAKYREAAARDNINAAPPEARIISRATPAIKPAYPKKTADRADRGVRRHSRCRRASLWPVRCWRRPPHMPMRQHYVPPPAMPRTPANLSSPQMLYRRHCRRWCRAGTRCRMTAPLVVQHGRKVRPRAATGGRRPPRHRGRHRTQCRHNICRDHAGAGAGARSQRGAGGSRLRRAQSVSDLDRSERARHRRTGARHGVVRRNHHPRPIFARALVATGNVGSDVAGACRFADAGDGDRGAGAQLRSRGDRYGLGRRCRGRALAPLAQRANAGGGRSGQSRDTRRRRAHAAGGL